MKKLCLFSLLLSVCLLTGCTKNYKTVDEYIEAMNQIKAGYNNTYTLDAEIQSKEPGKTNEGYYKSSIKNNKWKIDMSEDGGETFPSSMLYDGNEILVYSDSSPYAMVNPISAMLQNDKDTERKNFLISTQNPTLMLINWEKSFDISPQNAPVGEFVNNKDNRNGFDCRLIKFDDGREVCVNDKFGIAVYMHISIQNPKNPKNPKMNSELNINLKKFDSTDIPDSTFELPEGKKRMTFESMLQDMSKMFKDINKTKF